MYDSAFKDPKPSLQTLRKSSVSIGLLNTHFSVSFPRSYLPNMIEVAGMQIKTESTRLPSDIKQFIEDAPYGVIYFSMGSNLRPSKMPIEKRNAIIEAFSKQNVRILWKYDDDTMAVDREKVMIKKWFPQDDVLAHRNVRIFITHGGLLSCTEALYHGIPLIGIPVFGDQQTNMDRSVSSGWGLRLDFGNLTASSLKWAIDEMLTNDKYVQKNVSKACIFFF
jgi:glucuronosyltransferase